MYRKNLTEKQYRILKFIYEFADQKGLPPTIREIGDEFDIASTKGVTDHLDALERKGWLSRESGQARGIHLAQDKVERLFGAEKGVPLVGRVTAGGPTLAVENVEGKLDLDEMFSNRGDLFALRVKGDSMKGAGIHKGDILIVRQQSRAEVGDIVVAIIGEEEGTVKKISKLNEEIVLEPANPDYDPIVKPAEEVEIRGLVVGVIRKV